MMDSLKASVVIPVYNGEKTIVACLRSIFAAKTSDFEVIVIDDGSTDATAFLLKQFDCRVINLSKNKGRGYARNRGIEAAQAPVVLFTDADCIVSKDWISQALNELEVIKQKDPRIVGAVGRILPMKGFFNKCDAYTAYGYNQNNRPAYADSFCTSNFIVDRQAILTVGLFDESLPTFEDLDLGLRILERGERLFYQPKMVVFHNHTRLGLKGFLRHEYKWGLSIGNHFECKYPRYHRTPISQWMNSYFVYFVSAPAFAFLITLKIVTRNVFFDPSVLLFAPFIFASKILFRFGALKHLAQRRTVDYTYYDIKNQKGYETSNRSNIEG